MGLQSPHTALYHWHTIIKQACAIVTAPAATAAGESTTGGTNEGVRTKYPMKRTATETEEENQGRVHMDKEDSSMPTPKAKGKSRQSSQAQGKVVKRVMVDAENDEQFEIQAETYYQSDENHQDESNDVGVGRQIQDEEPVSEHYEEEPSRISSSSLEVSTRRPFGRSFYTRSQVAKDRSCSGKEHCARHQMFKETPRAYMFSEDDDFRGVTPSHTIRQPTLRTEALPSKQPRTKSSGRIICHWSMIT